MRLRRSLVRARSLWRWRDARSGGRSPTLTSSRCSSCIATVVTSKISKRVSSGRWEALLTMPEFLFRLELPPVDTRPAAVYQLTDFELATRLSFFLWRSIPDDELLGLAADDQLSEPTILSEQVRPDDGRPAGHAVLERFFGGNGCRFATSTPRTRTGPCSPVSTTPFAETCSARRNSSSRARCARTARSQSSSAPTTRISTRGSLGTMVYRTSMAVDSGRVTWADDRRHGLLWARESPDSNVVCKPYVGRAQREVGARDAARLPASATPSERPTARGTGREQPHFPARADGAAQTEPSVCKLPPPHGSVGICHGALRRDRALARD